MVRIVIAGGTLTILIVATIILTRELKDIPRLRRWANLLFPLSQISILGFLFYYLITFDLPFWLIVVVAVVGVLCGVGDIALFKALRTAEEKELAEERVRILENQIVMQKEYHRQLERDVQEAQNVRTRIVEELEEVSRLLEQQETQEASAQLRKAAHLMAPTNGPVCEHQIISALLIIKSQVCEELGIRMTFELEIPFDLPLPSVDVCAVFSNTLDNAIHGCEEVERAARFLTMKAHVVAGYFILDITNSCAEEVPTRIQKKRFLLTGSGLPKHGWGLMILEGIAMRYEGSLKTEKVDAVYRTTIALKLDIER